MDSVTFRTFPFTVFQSQVFVDEATDMATLRRWKKPVSFVDMATVPLAFILKHIDKGTPSGVGDGLSKTVVFDHVPNSKTFNSTLAL